MRTSFRRVCGSLTFLATLVATHAAGSDRDAVTLYGDYCAACHGSDLAGGKGGSLVSGRWKHGGDQESLVQSIQRGYPSGGMPGFSRTINAAETNALVAYILEFATRRVDPAVGEEKPLPAGIRKSEEHEYRFEVVAEGLDVPWSLAFLPDSRILVTERVGRLRVIERGQLQPEPISGVPEVIVQDEAGLMTVLADPDFAHNGWIYLSFSDPGEPGTAMVKVIRARLRDGRLVDHEDIFAVPRGEYQKSFVLFGGRMVFQGEHLFLSVGERGMEEGATGQAQSLATPVGKIHRIYADGRVPADNPFADRPGAVRSIWSYGVRNPQGLTVDPRTGELWETEHGPRGGDELNVIRRGQNYGWPVVSFGMNYDGTPVTDRTEAPGMEPPVINWTPSIAVSQVEFYRGDRFPRWKNQLFVGSLAQQKFLRVVLEGDRAVHTEEVFRGLGRIRDIKTGPDGFLYVALELIGKPGRIVRLVPAEP